MRTSSRAPAVAPRRVPDYNHRTRIPAWAIRDFVARVAARYKPLKIILFGSYARGNFTRDSDVDILVVTQKRRRRDLSVRIRRHVRSQFPLDLIVTHEARLKRRIELGDYFLKDVLSEGRVLYEAPDGRVGPESRGRLRRRHRPEPAA